MCCLWCLIATNANIIIAIAAVLGTFFTALYLITTIFIFIQTKKSADAAKQSADLFADQIKEEKRRHWVTVQAGVFGAFKANSAWRKGINQLQNQIQSKSVPPTDNLLWPDTIVQYAAEKDLDDALKISAAFADMRRAHDAIESVRQIDNTGGVNNGPIQRAEQEATDYLDDANDKLSELLPSLEIPNPDA